MSTWTLPTASGSYVVGLAPGDQGLVLHHWGGPVQAEPPAPSLPRRAASFVRDLDLLPMEATALGTRDVHAAEIVARRADGVRGLRLSLAGEIEHGVEDDGGTRLVCPLADPVAQIEVDLHLRSHPSHDVITKWATIRNRSPHAVELLRGWGGAFEAPTGAGAEIEVRTGAWSRETTPSLVDLTAGTLSVGSRQGITSHTAAPAVTARPRGVPDGDAWSVALAWSGSWRLAVDVVPFVGSVRIAGGPDDESGILTLAPGTSLTTPVLAGLWAHGDGDAVANAWHTYQRTLARSSGPEHRPVVYNSWYATTFDVTLEHQRELAEVAAGLGVEVFVVDDGWFRGRTSDRSGLGDWEPDPAKLPEGLAPLAGAVAERGMRFGLWVEPEAVNPDSDLYREHPDWVHHVDGRPLRTLRHQYVLDLGRPDVEAWVIGMLCRVLGSADITYLKWDMNRAIADGGQTEPGGDDWAWRHTHAYYRVMEMLRAEFPQVTVEACAGGGGRIDLAVLERSDVVWPSDETGPRDRLAIQHGFLGIYPAWTMSSWVTDEPDILDGEPASLDFRFVVAAAGVLGIGSDLLAWDERTRACAADHVARYRRIRDVVHGGRLRRHGSPDGAAYALQYALGERVVVLAWRRSGGALAVPVAGADPAGRYRVLWGSGEVEERTGDELLAGLPVPWSWDDCDIAELVRL
ncbi:alpha-galactosidase [Pseudactinotalea terrae]|uniref:alpha-galactosidase n=1 Tax=Pseudactinotalea terrae TaxID=1743262 RepID=UPI001391183D|nr:alpha-galactosidase [Pseudactinotalea terrae]